MLGLKARKSIWQTRKGKRNCKKTLVPVMEPRKCLHHGKMHLLKKRKLKIHQVEQSSQFFTSSIHIHKIMRTYSSEQERKSLLSAKLYKKMKRRITGRTFSLKIPLITTETTRSISLQQVALIHKPIINTRF